MIILQSRQLREEEHRASPVHPPINVITDALSFKVARLSAINERAGSAHFKSRYNITLNQWRVLGLAVALGAVSSREIRDTLYMDKGQFSRTVKSLVDDGYLQADPDNNDARTIILSATRKGVGFHDELIAFTAERNEAVVSVLTADECRTFLDLLDKLRGHNETLQKEAGII